MARSIALRNIAAVLILPLAGCSFFGIDTRPGIEYATITERRPVKEPMYQRQVPGTNLVKRWPAQKGLAYGYAPWEKKNDAVMVAEEASEASASASVASGQGKAPAARPSSPPARTQAKSPASQVNLAANWAPRNEADPIRPKSHLHQPPRTPLATLEEDNRAATGLIQPRTITPRGATAQVDVATADDEAAPPPEQPQSNLPNVHDPSDEQQTPEE